MKILTAIQLSSPPPQLVIIFKDQNETKGEYLGLKNIDPAIQQSWYLPNAKEIIKSCKKRVAVLQCIFNNSLEPRSIASYLLNLADYLFNAGDVIETNHTIPGLDEEEVWLCQRQESQVEPFRLVIDIQPRRNLK